MSSRLRLLLPLLLALLLTLAACPVLADDGIFPPAPAAKPFIDFDGRGFLIAGKRTFLVSGSLHYCRVPRALWRDRLLRMKRAGFNTVQTYAFWNFHEPQEGKWNFSGDHDLDAFLKLIKSLGMYAVVRVGPYVCAEWDSGGYPVWLRFKPGVRVREDNPPFEAAVDRWYEKVIPIVAANQILRGGAVIMVQLENEHPLGWGRDMPNGYFKHLRDKALALGLEVPYFFSGLHHGSDPAGGDPWDSKGRSNPWYSTEFWPGWYDLYGPLNPGRFRYFDRGTWKILAYGGNGYNYYMLHGGTNFDTWNDDEVASSYDYSGAIGQAGDLRPIYYRFKRAALFARSFASILEDSDNATEQYKDITTDKTLRVTARKSPAGSLLFVDNAGEKEVSTQIHLGQEADALSEPLTILPGEIRPIVLNSPLLLNVTLDLATARVLGITQQGDTTTIVVYGPPAVDANAAIEHFQSNEIKAGSPLTQQTAVAVTETQDSAKLVFSAPGGVSVTKGGSDLAVNGSHLTLTPRFSVTGMEERAFTAGKSTVRVLAVSWQIVNQIWFIDIAGVNYVVIGPEYVGAAEIQGGRLRLITERPYASGIEPQQTVVYGPAAEPIHLGRDQSPQIENVPVLSSWRMRPGDAEAAVGYTASGWKRSMDPLPMGADGDTSAYAWYRSTLFAPTAGAYTLHFSDVGDWADVWINGKPVGGSSPKQRFTRPVPYDTAVTLRQGANTLAVLTAHYGRHKLFSYLGPIDHIDAKGIGGPVTLSPLTTEGEKGRKGEGEIKQIGNREQGTGNSQSTIDNPLHPTPDTRHPIVVRGWSMRGGIGDLQGKASDWKPYDGLTAAGIPTFYRTDFDAAPPAPTGDHRILRVSLQGMSRGFVWLNGHNLGRYPERVPVDGLYLPECWLQAGKNHLVIFDEEGHAPALVKIVVETASSRAVTEQDQR